MPHEISRRQLLKSGLFVAGGVVASPLVVSALDMFGAPLALGATTLPWSAANTIVANTKQPKFPNRTRTITHHGAVGDGKTDNTAVINSVIATCSKDGGGHVVVPAGTFATGAIYLKSNVDLHLDSGAVLAFSGNVSKYPTVLTRYEGIECMNHSPLIYAHGEHNIAITGSGTLDAGATVSWNVGNDRAYLEDLVAKGVPANKRIVPGSGHTMRSAFIEPYSCDTVLISGVTLKNAQFWQMHPTLCTNVTVDGVTTTATKANTDGCDPECCDHVVIRNCSLQGGDDNIAIKSGRDTDGRHINVPSQNIVIYNCTMAGPWGAVTCGSELTGGIQNVYAFNCVATGTRYALFVKSNTLRGGFARNINLDTVTGHNQKLAFGFIGMNYMGQKGSFPPDFNGFTITNSKADHTPYAFDLEGLSGDPIHNVTGKNLTFTNITHNTDIVTNVSGLKFTNVTINGHHVSK